MMEISSPLQPPVPVFDTRAAPSVFDVVVGAVITAAACVPSPVRFLFLFLRS